MTTWQKIIHLGAYLFGVALTLAAIVATIGIALGSVWAVAEITKNLITGG